MRSEPISKSHLPDSNRLGPTLSIWWHFIHRTMATNFYQQKSDANTLSRILPSRIRIHQPKGRVHQQFTNRKLEFCHQNRWILAIQNHRLVTDGDSGTVPVPARGWGRSTFGWSACDANAMVKLPGNGASKQETWYIYIYTYYILIHNYIYIYVHIYIYMQSWLAGESPTNK